MNSYSWFIAKRYFFGKQKKNKFLSFIRIMAISGVAIGSAGLLISLSVVHGFKSVINEKIYGYGPEIVIKSFSNYPLYQTDTLITFLKKYPEVDIIQPVIQTQAMLQNGNDVEGILLRGIVSQDSITDLPKYIRKGTFLTQPSTLGSQPIVIGEKLRKDLSLQVDEPVYLFTMKGIPTKSNQPEIKKTILAGVYELGIDKFDSGLAFVPIEMLRKMVNYEKNQADMLYIKTKKSTDLREFNAFLNDQLSYPLFTESVLETYSSLFAWVNLQEQTIPVVISVMIIVAAFNLIGTILMMILERVSDIGILKTMGAYDSVVKHIFLLQGTFIATVGLLIGIGISLLFYWLQTEFSLIHLPQENYYMSTAPVQPHLSDFLIVSAVTYVLTLLASYIPAKVSVSIKPLKVIAFGRS